MKTKLKYALIALLCICSIPTLATNKHENDSIKSDKGLSMGISFRAGGSKLLYDSRYYGDLFLEKSPLIADFNVKLSWRDNSKSIYANTCCHPEFGIAIGTDMVGLAKPANNPDVKSQGVGNLYSLYGFIDRPWFRTKIFALGYSAGWGLGFCFNHLLDPVNNPANVMISFPVMWHATLGLQGQFTIYDKHVIGLGFYFNHYSNGAFYWRNRGFNGFELALSYGLLDIDHHSTTQSTILIDSALYDISSIQSITTKNDIKTKKEKPRLLAMYGENFRPGFQFDLQVSGGVMALENYYDYTEARDGVGKNIHRFKCSIQGDCLYKYCKTQASGLGLDVFFTPFCDELAEHYVLYKKEQDATYTKEYMSYKNATRADLKDENKVIYQPVSFGISFVHEFCYRNLTAAASIGYYIYDNDGLAQSTKPIYKLYQYLNLKYHFPSLCDTYAGIVLKAHKFMAAENVQICIGKRF